MYDSFEDRHAPQTWQDLVFADSQTEEELRDYQQGKAFGHILLHGPIGTAKSTTAMLIAKGSTKVDRPRMWNAKTEDLWKSIESFITVGGSFAMLHGGCYYCVIDEVDQLKGDQERLSNAMSNAHNVRFIVTTNFLADVQPRLIDRCESFAMEPPTAQQWLPRARSILQAEGLAINDTIILKYLDGNTRSMRRVMGALDKLVRSTKRPQGPTTQLVTTPVINPTL